MHGKIDIVCANAGINDRVNFLADNEDEPIWDVLDVDLKGVMMSTPPTVSIAVSRKERLIGSD